MPVQPRERDSCCAVCTRATWQERVVRVEKQKQKAEYEWLVISQGFWSSPHESAGRAGGERGGDRDPPTRGTSGRPVRGSDGRGSSRPPPQRGFCGLGAKALTRPRLAAATGVRKSDLSVMLGAALYQRPGGTRGSAGGRGARGQAAGGRPPHAGPPRAAPRPPRPHFRPPTPQGAAAAAGVGGRALATPHPSPSPAPAQP